MEQSSPTPPPPTPLHYSLSPTLGPITPLTPYITPHTCSYPHTLHLTLLRATTVTGLVVHPLPSHPCPLITVSTLPPQALDSLTPLDSSPWVNHGWVTLSSDSVTQVTVPGGRVGVVRVTIHGPMTGGDTRVGLRMLVVNGVEEGGFGRGEEVFDDIEGLLGAGEDEDEASAVPPPTPPPPHPVAAHLAAAVSQGDYHSAKALSKFLKGIDKLTNEMTAERMRERGSANREDYDKAQLCNDACALLQNKIDTATAKLNITDESTPKGIAATIREAKPHVAIPSKDPVKLEVRNAITHQFTYPYAGPTHLLELGLNELSAETHLLWLDALRTATVQGVITQQELLNEVTAAIGAAGTDVSGTMIEQLTGVVLGGEATFFKREDTCAENTIRALAWIFGRLCEGGSSLALVKTTVVTLADTLGVGVVGNAALRLSDYEEVVFQCGVVAALIDSYGIEEGGWACAECVVGVVRGAGRHRNGRVREAAGEVCRASVEAGMPIEYFDGLLGEGIIQTIKEGEESRRKRIAEENTLQLEEVRKRKNEKEARMQALVVKVEVEKVREEARRIGERLEEEVKWRTKMRGAELLKFAGSMVVAAVSDGKKFHQSEKVTELRKVEEEAAVGRIKEDMVKEVEEMENGETHEEREKVDMTSEEKEETAAEISAENEQKKALEQEQREIEEGVAAALEKKRLEEEREKKEDGDDEAELEKLLHSPGKKANEEEHVKKKETKEEKEARRAERKAEKKKKEKDGGEEKKEEVKEEEVQEEAKAEEVKEEEVKEEIEEEAKVEEVKAEEIAPEIAPAQVQEENKEVQEKAEKKEVQEKEEKALKAIVQKTSPRLDDVVAKQNAVNKVAEKVEEKIEVKKKKGCIVS